MAYRMVEEASLVAVAEAIRERNGSAHALTFPDGFVQAIQTVGSGASGDVRFLDYDGTVLYAYSLEQVQALTGLPPLPAHDGLVCQGWNRTLESIQALQGPVTVGAMYITDDGATRLGIRIAVPGRMAVPLYIGQTVANGVSIDWGDGSDEETLSGTGNVNTTHTYAQPGDYTISLMPDDGCTLSFGNGTSGCCVLGSVDSSGKVYTNMLRAVCIGKNVSAVRSYGFHDCSGLKTVTIPRGVGSIGGYAFQDCYSLVSLTIPDGVSAVGRNTFQNCQSMVAVSIPEGVTSIADYAFQDCHSLAQIAIPLGVSTVGNYAFQYCRALEGAVIPQGVTAVADHGFQYCSSLAEAVIPEGVTTIGGYAFQDCQGLARVRVPGSVTEIGSNAFSGCGGVECFDFSGCAAVPTLSNTSAFSGIAADCQIRVPAALLAQWSAATNWVAYADKIIGV